MRPRVLHQQCVGHPGMHIVGTCRFIRRRAWSKSCSKNHSPVPGCRAAAGVKGVLMRHSSGRGTLMWLQRTQLAGGAAGVAASASPFKAKNASSPTTRVRRHTGKWLARQCGVIVCAVGHTHTRATGRHLHCAAGCLGSHIKVNM